MKKSTPIPSIFKNRNPDLVRMFAAAGHPRRVMCVALDYAKQTHTVLPANGEGERLMESKRPTYGLVDTVLSASHWAGV